MFNFAEITHCSSTTALTVTYELSYSTVGFPFKNVGSDATDKITDCGVSCYSVTLTGFVTKMYDVYYSSYIAIGY